MVAALKYLYVQSYLWKDGLMNTSPVVFVLVLLSIIVTPCSATQSQGLEWNYNEGTRYDFRETSQVSDNETSRVGYDWTYYLIAGSYYELDDPLNASRGLPLKRAMTYWQNGTEMKTGPMSFAVPVGNWSLLSMVVENMSYSSFSFSAFESDNIWGYEQRHIERSTYIYRWEFSKSNGVLEKFTGEYSFNSHHQLIIVERLPFSPGVIQLGITIGAAACIVLVILAYHKMKK